MTRHSRFRCSSSICTSDKAGSSTATATATSAVAAAGAGGRRGRPGANASAGKAAPRATTIKLPTTKTFTASTAATTTNSNSSGGSATANNLPLLQNLIRRDPSSYRPEFILQLRHLDSLLQVILLAPQLQQLPQQQQPNRTPSSQQSVSEILAFVAHTLPCYYNATDKSPESAMIAALPSRLLSLLAPPLCYSLCPTIRRAIVNALILLRNKGVMELSELMPALMPLLGAADKLLRASVHSFIVTAIAKKKILRKCSNVIVNVNAQERAVHSQFLAALAASLASLKNCTSNTNTGKNINVNINMNNTCDSTALTLNLLGIAIELYRRRVWNEAKTANAIAEAVFCVSHPTIMLRAVHFFLDSAANKLAKKSRSKNSSSNADDGGGSDDSDDDDDDNNDSKSDADAASVRRSPALAASQLMRMKHANHVGRKTRASERKLLRASRILDIARGNSKSSRKSRILTNPANAANLSCIELIYGANAYAQRLYGLASSPSLLLDTRLSLLRFLSLVSSAHSLVVSPLYSYVAKFLQPRQIHVTAFLALAAQCMHDAVPPEDAAALVAVVANNFVTDQASADAVAAGLMAIREICARVTTPPHGMTRELLADLVSYRKNRSKGVVIAARSLLSLFRARAPQLLPRRQLGREIGAKLTRKARIAAAYQDGLLVPGSTESNTLTTTTTATAATASSSSSSSNSNSNSNRLAGIELLEEHLKKNGAGKLNAEEDDDDNDDDDDGDDLEFSSEDDQDDGSECSSEIEFGSDSDESEEDSNADSSGSEAAETTQEPPSNEPLETTRFLTQEELTLINTLRRQKAEDEPDGQLANTAASVCATDASSAVVNPEDLLRYSKKRKADYDERMASIKAGREGREKFGSRKGTKRVAGQSSSNLSKLRKKNFAMVSHSRKVMTKAKASLREKQRNLRKHIERSKKQRRK